MKFTLFSFVLLTVASQTLAQNSATYRNLTEVERDCFTAVTQVLAVLVGNCTNPSDGTDYVQRMEAENKRLCTEPKCYNAAVGTGLDSLITEKCPPTSEFTTEFASTLAPYFKYRSQSDIDKYPNCYQENGKYCYAEFSIALFDVNLNQTNKTALCSSCTKNLLNKFTASLNTGIGGVVNSNDEKDLNTTRALVMSKCGNDFFSTSGSVSGSSSTSTSGSASLISMNVMHFAVVATMGIFMVL